MGRSSASFRASQCSFPIEVAAGAEEHVQHGVLLHLAALGGVEEEDLAGVIDGVGDLAVGEIPIFVIAGVKGGFAQLGFVVGQVLGDLVLFQQCLALAVVRRAGGEVGAEFAGQRRLDIDFLLGIEKRRELVELLLADGVVLVVVALRAAHGEAHPNGAERGRAIQHLLVAELFGVGAAFAIGEGVAIEAGGDQGVEIAIGQQVAGELLDGELVEGEVAIERVDHPVAIAPGPGARAIFFVAVAIGVARQVEPVARPLLAVVRRIEQAVHQAFIGVGAVVVEELADLFGGGGKAGKIEADAAEQGQLRGFGARARCFSRSRRARMKLSTALRAQARSRTAGTAGR